MQWKLVETFQYSKVYECSSCCAQIKIMSDHDIADVKKCPQCYQFVHPATFTDPARQAHFDHAFRLIFEAYASPRDCYDDDDAYIIALRIRVTEAHTHMQKLKYGLGHPFNADTPPPDPIK